MHALNCTLKFEDSVIIDMWLREELKVPDLHRRKILKLWGVSNFSFSSSNSSGTNLWFTHCQSLQASCCAYPVANTSPPTCLQHSPVVTCQRLLSGNISDFLFEDFLQPLEETHWKPGKLKVLENWCFQKLSSTSDR